MNNKKINCNDYCRTCAETGATYKIFDLEENIKFNIAELILKLTDIAVSKEDDLPKSICNICFNTLALTHTFIMTCQKSQSKLIQQMSSHFNSDSDLSIQRCVELFKLHFDKDDIDNMDDSDVGSNETEAVLADNNSDGNINNDKSVERDLNDTVELEGADLNLFEIMEKVFIREKAVKDVSPPKRPKKKRCQEINSDENINGLVEMLQKEVSEKRKKNIEEKNTCKLCGKLFKRAEYLKRHIRYTHGTIDRKYMCEICAVRVKCLASLNSHVRHCHTGVRTIACDMCPYRCVSKSELTRHRMKHNSIQRFTCDICGVRFKHHSSFLRHQRIHAGVKRYKCRECNMLFLKPAQMQAHERSAHNLCYIYACPLCSVTYTKRIRLKLHIKSKHEDDADVDIVRCRLATRIAS